jgi:hypothetical protein
MASYEVEIQRTIYTTVGVEADNPEAARAKVESVLFPLPPLSEWEALDGEEIIVWGEDGEEVEVSV